MIDPQKVIFNDVIARVKQSIFNYYHDIQLIIDQKIKKIKNKERDIEFTKKNRFCKELSFENKLRVDAIFLENMVEGTFCKILDNNICNEYTEDKLSWFYGILIQLLFQIKEFEIYGITHGDLHVNNVMFTTDINYNDKIQKYYEYRYVDTADKEQKIKSIYVKIRPIIPKILDFDKAAFFNEEKKFIRELPIININFNFENEKDFLESLDEIIKKIDEIFVFIDKNDIASIDINVQKDISEAKQKLETLINDYGSRKTVYDKKIAKKEIDDINVTKNIEDLNKIIYNLRKKKYTIFTNENLIVSKGDYNTLIGSLLSSLQNKFKTNPLGIWNIANPITMDEVEKKNFIDSTYTTNINVKFKYTDEQICKKINKNDKYINFIFHLMKIVSIVGMNYDKKNSELIEFIKNVDGKDEKINYKLFNINNKKNNQIIDQFKMEIDDNLITSLTPLNKYKKEGDVYTIVGDEYEINYGSIESFLYMIKDLTNFFNIEKIEGPIMAIDLYKNTFVAKLDDKIKEYNEENLTWLYGVLIHLLFETKNMEMQNIIYGNLSINNIIFIYDKHYDPKKTKYYEYTIKDEINKKTYTIHIKVDEFYPKIKESLDESDITDLSTIKYKLKNKLKMKSDIVKEFENLKKIIETIKEIFQVYLNKNYIQELLKNLIELDDYINKSILDYQTIFADLIEKKYDSDQIEINKNIIKINEKINELMEENKYNIFSNNELFESRGDFNTLLGSILVSLNSKLNNNNLWDIKDPDLGPIIPLPEGKYSKDINIKFQYKNKQIWDYKDCKECERFNKFIFNLMKIVSILGLDKIQPHKDIDGKIRLNYDQLEKTINQYKLEITGDFASDDYKTVLTEIKDKNFEVNYGTISSFFECVKKLTGSLLKYDGVSEIIKIPPITEELKGGTKKQSYYKYFLTK